MEIELATLPNDDGISVRPAVKCPGCGKKLETPTAEDFAAEDYGCRECGQSIDLDEVRNALHNSPMNLRNDPRLLSGDSSTPKRGSVPQVAPELGLGGGGTSRQRDLPAAATTPGPWQGMASGAQRPREPDMSKEVSGGFGVALFVMALLFAALDLPEEKEVVWGLLIWAIIGGVIGLSMYLRAWASYRRAMDDWLMTYAEGLANDAARERLAPE